MLSRLPEEGLLEAENWFFMRLEKGDSSGEVSFVDSCFPLLVLISCVCFCSGAFFNIFFTGFFSFFRFLGLNLMSGLGFKLCCLGRHLPVLPRRLSGPELLF